ncbi:PTS system mannose/fructose/N-acetylgalactosamine-transporter subunit IIB [Pediococcus claussenii]|uniref:PTS system sorbose subIIB component family protein n=1 Tax=Pediococcus claussenii (strain ATCC BAA-344 / DSM 14800 / JCM 18046 / KCTC 3811 / LMG 21948 / P06) TaxID=701521 RepID=G8PB28_PEDCP|nr:PTS sugar transporter subunit IIB [Pediococcus claussenii]AEV94657.1 PTS system sorbose subIIB component family protein [Pediococcus claussenii ATCC BAA-344]ANZ69859.1 PTS fructose transporter subunit IIB [Pediococcus claussenii]ANZ71676.1 PTS fructose transporter subunit IIB [Pediococcus claussenii]KRN20837.1 hypothetical protein IV79_GL000057 [Pediococcus claussenii]
MTMDIRLARVDSRLLHGQVATSWAKTIIPDRILVVSDAAADNDLRKTLITQAAPPGVGTNVITVDRMLDIYDDPQFDGLKILLLTETVQDMLKLVNGGVQLKGLGIDIGSLAFSDGMTLITDAIAVGPSEAKSIRDLHNLGLEVFAQKIPNDGKKDVLPMLEKAGF